MELVHTCYLKLEFEHLFWKGGKNMSSMLATIACKIRDVVRDKAQEIPKFREGSGGGAIRILAYPACREADDWFGGLGDFSKTPYDIPDYEVTFAIKTGGSRVTTGVWDGVEQRVDCYGYSALKIAHCSLAQDLGVGLLSGLNLHKPHLTEDNGYGPYLGALCVEVNWTNGDNIIKPFCGIYVCVSGADSADDLRCAIAAIEVIKEFFTDKDGFTINAPGFPAK